MGVPKFYRWISERYPCLSEVVKEFQIPNFDNLYLDMNGIIHVCSHPDDNNPHFRISEEDIFYHIFEYIELLFQMVKPRKVFYMAVDGVAPRAKMNQQRGRRFKSAREAENLIKQAKDRGEELPTEKRFDSNCITPGTEFMVRLQTQLQFFVTRKVSLDPLWKGVEVYLSGHETPGEGEHKIMDYIRWLRSKPSYDPTTRHCVYGLDADLMFLGLTLHEPYFSLLREEVRFGGKKDNTKRSMTAKETTFHLLHLSMLREYIYFEFSQLEYKLPFPFDIERIIDDWVLMGFLVGNDFIPHLPNLHIHLEGLPMLWQTYIEVLPMCDGYLTDAGELNLERFQKYIGALSKLDFEKFQETNADVTWLRRKSSHGRRQSELERSLSNGKKSRDLEEWLVHSDGTEGESLENDPSGRANTSQGVIDHDKTEEECFWEYKKEYYQTKLKYHEVTDEVLREQALTYVTALQWNLYYYFDGCQSWSWFYPYHYAPFMSDLVNIADFEIKLDMGRPYLPFQQLMSVLPSASKDLLPPALQDLMVKDSSPIKKYYPEDFETDMNGKLHEWEAVVLIPFINEVELLSAMKMVESRLTKSEIKRNHHSPHLLYRYHDYNFGKYPSTLSKFPSVYPNNASCSLISGDSFHVHREDLLKGLLLSNQEDRYFPGFPTFHHLRLRSELKRAEVKVFQYNSKHDNMIVEIITDSDKDLRHTAEDLLGKTLLVSWPHLSEVKVLSVLNERMKYFVSDGSNPTITSERLNETDQRVFQATCNGIAEKYYSTRGIEIGPTTVIVNGCPVTGRKYVTGKDGKIKLQKEYSKTTLPFALQATVQMEVSEEAEYFSINNIDEVFTQGCSVFMLEGLYYGYHGTVASTNEEEGTVTVSVQLPTEPCLEYIRHNQREFEEVYETPYNAARRLQPPFRGCQYMSHLAECVFITRASKGDPSAPERRVNIGLNMKVHRHKEEAPGFTKFKDDRWFYSRKAVDCIDRYLQRFPEMFAMVLSRGHSYNECLNETQIFSDLNYTLQDVLDYIKTLPCSAVKLQKAGGMLLDEGVVEAIADKVQRLQNMSRDEEITEQVVKPEKLFKPLISVCNAIPDPSVEYHLFDRVINIREGLGSLRCGQRGTVVGIREPDKPFSTLYNILFDEPFAEGVEMGNVPHCGYHLTMHDMMNLTHSKRLKQQSKGLHLLSLSDSSFAKVWDILKRLNTSEGDSHGTSSCSEGVVSRRESETSLTSTTSDRNLSPVGRGTGVRGCAGWGPKTKDEVRAGRGAYLRDEAYIVGRGSDGKRPGVMCRTSPGIGTDHRYRANAESGANLIKRSSIGTGANVGIRTHAGIRTSVGCSTSFGTGTSSNRSEATYRDGTSVRDESKVGSSNDASVGRSGTNIRDGDGVGNETSVGGSATNVGRSETNVDSSCRASTSCSTDISKDVNFGSASSIGSTGAIVSGANSISGGTWSQSRSDSTVDSATSGVTSDILHVTSEPEAATTSSCSRTASRKKGNAGNRKPSDNCCSLTDAAQALGKLPVSMAANAANAGSDKTGCSSNNNNNSRSGGGGAGNNNNNSNNSKRSNRKKKAGKSSRIAAATCISPGKGGGGGGSVGGGGGGGGSSSGSRSSSRGSGGGGGGGGGGGRSGDHGNGSVNEQKQHHHHHNNNNNNSNNSQGSRLVLSHLFKQAEVAAAAVSSIEAVGGGGDERDAAPPRGKTHKSTPPRQQQRQRQQQQASTRSSGSSSPPPLLLHHPASSSSSSALGHPAVAAAAAADEEGTAALKKMLNLDNPIGQPPGASPSGGGGGAFTHQVTFQELVQGVKKLNVVSNPPNVDQTAGYGGQVQTQPTSSYADMAHQQQQQQQQQQLYQPLRKQSADAPSTPAGCKVPQQRPRGSTLVSLGFDKHRNQKNTTTANPGGRRNKATELQELCVHFGLGRPKYDFSGTKNNVTACVTLSNGNRFQGTPCVTQGEAVESTAHLALYHLSSQNMMPSQVPLSAPPSVPQMGQVPHQFSSPNSAFSPVIPRCPAPEN